MSFMNAQSIISHRLFVAALSHDEREASRKRRPNKPAASAAIRGRRARASTVSEASRSDYFRPKRSGFQSLKT